MSEIEWGKKTAYTTDEAREFWEEARAMVERWACNFEGVYFPEDPDKIGFHGIEFKVDANFRKAEFAGVAIFFLAKFSGNANFREAKFGEEAFFRGAEFGGMANFHSAKFGGNAKFIEAKFGGEAKFWHAEFSGGAMFDRVKFVGDADFEECRFHQKATMDLAVSRGTFLIDRPPKWLSSTGRTFARMGQGFDAYRMAKQSATDRGDYSLAGDYHLAEQTIRCWSELISGGRWLRGLDFPSKKEEEAEAEIQKTALQDKLLKGCRKVGASLWYILQGFGRVVSALVGMVFGRFLFGYGERPLRVLAAAVLVIFGWAKLYYPYGIAMDNIPEVGPPCPVNFAERLYFSVVTFTTLGYGDLQPATDMRFWAGLEALTGAFLMALFVVAMARKFTR